MSSHPVNELKVVGTKEADKTVNNQETMHTGEPRVQNHPIRKFDLTAPIERQPAWSFSPDARDLPQTEQRYGAEHSCLSRVSGAAATTDKKGRASSFDGSFDLIKTEASSLASELPGAELPLQQPGFPLLLRPSLAFNREIERKGASDLQDRVRRSSDRPRSSRLQPSRRWKLPKLLFFAR
ncbi:hypothetical protein MA16_Dca007258 [Dendrobium catenatum]|uniref:Uncharacterized protein n=1 Tax=Dendrobium catenatum TaxID=906689 RepID=A0A2I0W6H9_9ASPA|nr:hypothetical protein MA16_Dca007258 [Dendrobium catenatum]